MIKSFQDYVLGTGPSNAQLMIVGEAPGQHEEEQGKPFVGATGELVTDLLEVAGIKRSQVYLTNVIKLRPPQNNLEMLCELDNPQTDQPYKIEDFLPLLNNEIEALQPNCILALGSLALETLTGKKGIQKYRGSILSYLNLPIKVVPTFHPAALFHRNYGKNGDKKTSGEGMQSWKSKAWIQFDFIKAVRESSTPDFNIPIRNLRVIRSSLHLEQFFSMYRDYNKVYVDTEVFKAGLVCIGFAFTPHEGVSIPLLDLQSDMNHRGIPLHELVEMWKIIDDRLADDGLKKVGQNFKADKVYWLEKAGFTVRGFTDDTMFKIHTLSSELPKSLAFQQSIYTNEPYHKSEGKEYNPHKDRIDDLLLYNAKDCVVNCECDIEMNKDLKELGLESFFYDFVMALYPVYEKIEKRGILLDQEKQKELSLFYKDLLELEVDKRTALLSMFGIEKDVNYNSPQQVSELIYVKLKCPLRKDTRDDTLTALMSNAVKNKEKKAIISSVLHSRSLHKLKETYVEATPDFDGRIRCTYNQVGTETGRTSTSTIKKPLRNGVWGVPFQTIPRPDEFGGRIREIFISDPNKLLIEFDQSQAEARIVALLANDLDLLALFDILDVHKLTASFCYGLTSHNGQDLIKAAIKQYIFASRFDTHTDDWIDFSFLDLVSDEQRQIGKNTRHGCNYDLGIEGLSIKQKISMYRARITMEKIHEMSPNIVGVFHEDIQNALGESRVMWTPFGRRREFFERWGKELFREAYAHYPQSVIGDNTKRAMLALKDVDWIEIVEEGHDSFLAQIPKGREKDCYDIVKPIFEQEIDFSIGTIKRNPISIPVGCKIGLNWGQMKKLKV